MVFGPSARVSQLEQNKFRGQNGCRGLVLSHRSQVGWVLGIQQGQIEEGVRKNGSHVLFETP